MNRPATAQTIGQCIRQSRTKSGLSLRALAERVGISAPFLSDIELGRRGPSPKVAKKLAATLGLSRDLLAKFDYRTDVTAFRGLLQSSPSLQAAFRSAMQQVREGGITAEELAGALAPSEAKTADRSLRGRH